MNSSYLMEAMNMFGIGMGEILEISTDKIGDLAAALPQMGSVLS